LLIHFKILYRAEQQTDTSTLFFLYVDEAHSFLFLSFADMLAEARKYGLSLFLTHQYLGQLQEDIRVANFGYEGTLIAFRVGAADALSLAKEFYPVFTQYDLVHLERFKMYLKLQVYGMTSRPCNSIKIVIN